MSINPANIGYLCGVLLKELSSGRTCEITGSIVATIKTHQDYIDRKYRLIGKFGEVTNRKNGVALIMTRAPPEWAEKMIDEKIWGCEEMLRWNVPVEER